MMRKISISKSSLSGSIIPPPSFEIAYHWVWGASLGEGGVFSNVPDCENMQRLFGLCNQIGADIQYDSKTVDIFGSQRPSQPRSIDCMNNSLVSRLALPLSVLFDYGSVLKNTKIPRSALSYIDDVANQFDFRSVKMKNEISIHGPAKNDTFELNGVAGAYWLNGFLYSCALAQSETYIFLDDYLSMHPSLKYTFDTFETFELNYYYNEQDHFVLIPSDQMFYSKYLDIPPSYKDASYYLGALLLGEGGEIKIPNDISQPQMNFWDTFEENNLISRNDTHITAYSDSFSQFVNTIDIRRHCSLIPLAIVLATQSHKDVQIGPLYPISPLAKKRIDLTCEQLRKVGAQITIDEKFVTVSPSILSGGSVDCTSDPRVASALCLAGLVCKKPLILHGCEIINKVNSRFLSDLKRLGADIKVL